MGKYQAFVGMERFWFHSQSQMQIAVSDVEKWSKNNKLQFVVFLVFFCFFLLVLQ